MATFVKHIGCPKCGSRDNRAVYDDGSEWCFGCRDYKGGEFRRHAPLDKAPKPLNYPDDAQNYIPVKPLTWLKGYGITDKEMVDHGIAFSPSRDLLIFPYYGDDDRVSLVAWQGRNFGSEGPKWYGHGNLSELLHLNPVWGKGVGRGKSQVCIVEDIVSAIKVGRHTTACPIFGSNVSLKTLVRLSERFEELVIWLDMDKHREALKSKSRASQLPFNKVSVISTEKDPKALTDREILNALQQ